MEEGEFGGVAPDDGGEGSEEEGDGDGEDGEGRRKSCLRWRRWERSALARDNSTRFGRDDVALEGWAHGRALLADSSIGIGGSKEEHGDCGMVRAMRIMAIREAVWRTDRGRVAGVVKEEVVLNAHVGDDGHGDLDVAAFVGGGEDVEGGESRGRGWCRQVVLRASWRRVGLGRYSCWNGRERSRWRAMPHLRIEIWGTRICEESNHGEEGQGVAGHDGGGGVGEPEEGDGDGDAGDGDRVGAAQDGVEEERDEGGGEEFGVGGALVCGEEHVGLTV